MDWLVRRGYERVGLLGTSLGSCLAMLTAAHEPRVTAVALNHISPYFADVVWEGLSTTHVRAGLEGAVELDRLRQLWLPISPQPFIGRMKSKQVLLVYARYDLSFPVRLSRQLVDDFRRHDIPAPGLRAAVWALQHGDRTVQLVGWLRPRQLPPQQSVEVGSSTLEPVSQLRRRTEGVEASDPLGARRENTGSM